MFYISTSWNFRRHTTAKGILSEILKTGVNGIELNFNLPRKIVDEFVLLQKRGECEVVSLHNYCPIPDGIDPREVSPDKPCLSALDESERSLAVAQTKNTIDYANRLHAKAVVLHIGRVEVKDKTILLSRISKDSPAFNEMKSGMIKERLGSARQYFEKSIKSLEELEPYAKEKDVSLGVESRYYYREIPSFEELSYILKHFGESSIYYWHDIGHAQTQEYLGFIRHEDYLQKYSQRLLGMHLHDIINIHDHLAPGKGSFEFKKIVSYLREDIIKVIEAHQPATVEDVKEGIAFLNKAIQQEQK